MPIIRNRKSGFTQDMDQDRWDAMKDLQVPGQKPGVLMKSLYDIIDPSELAKSNQNSNVPERMKIHPSGSSTTQSSTTEKKTVNEQSKNNGRRN